MIGHDKHFHSDGLAIGGEAGMSLLALVLVTAQPDVPIALGPAASVAAAARAARTCGMHDIRYDPLDRERAILLMGRENSSQAIDCTLRWIQQRRNALQFEPLLVEDPQS